MKIGRILSALIAIKHDLPAFDEETVTWCIEHNLSELIPIEGGNAADNLTATGSCFLAFVEAYADHLLRENHARGLLRRPNNNGTNEDHDTNEQGQHGTEGKAKPGKKVKDHAARYGRRTRVE